MTPENNDETSHSGPHKHNSDQRISNVAIVAALDRLVNQLRSNEDKQQSSEKKREGRERLTIKLVAVTIFLSLLTLLITHIDSERALTTAKVASNAALKNAHDDSVAALKMAHLDSVAALQKAHDDSVAALLSANSGSAAALGKAAEANATARDTESKQLQAYVAITNASLSSVNNGKSRISFTSENFGQTPARRVQVYSVAIINAIGIQAIVPQISNLKTRSSPNENVLYPHVPRHNSTDVDIWGARDTLETPITSTHTIVWYGRVKYIDIFNRPRYSEFCFIFSGVGPLPDQSMVCPNHHASN